MIRFVALVLALSIQQRARATPPPTPQAHPETLAPTGRGAFGVVACDGSYIPAIPPKPEQAHARENPRSFGLRSGARCRAPDLDGLMPRALREAWPGPDLAAELPDPATLSERWVRSDEHHDWLLDGYDRLGQDGIIVESWKTNPPLPEPQHALRRRAGAGWLVVTQQRGEERRVLYDEHARVVREWRAPGNRFEPATDTVSRYRGALPTRVARVTTPRITGAWCGTSALMEAERFPLGGGPRGTACQSLFDGSSRVWERTRHGHAVPVRTTRREKECTQGDRVWRETDVRQVTETFPLHLTDGATAIQHQRSKTSTPVRGEVTCLVAGGREQLVLRDEDGDRRWDRALGVYRHGIDPVISWHPTILDRVVDNELDGVVDQAYHTERDGRMIRLTMVAGGSPRVESWLRLDGLGRPVEAHRWTVDTFARSGAVSDVRWVHPDPPHRAVGVGTPRRSSAPGGTSPAVRR